MHKNKLCNFLIVFLIVSNNFGRSVHRPKDPLMPEIVTSWKEDTSTFTLRNSYLGEYPFFKLYNENYFKKYYLPDDSITSRYDEKKESSGSIMKKEIQELLKELHQHKTTFKYFVLLQDKDFNYKKVCGLLVVKFKNHPFVLKLFMETPESLTNPYNKGFEPVFFFFMGNGVSRHMSGFTRIRNRELVLEKIKSDQKWSSRIDIPRKWFWIPPENRPIVINGKNIGPHATISTEIPGTYCIIADAIQSERKFSISEFKDRSLALELCNDLDLLIDPHIKNFMEEKKTKKLVIVDTEHFPTVVGLKEDKKFKSYLEWYFYLVSKCGRDMFFKTKKERRAAQRNPHGRFLTYE